MPYELTFTKKIAITDREQYINECCVGGDHVLKVLLPSLQSHYEDVDTGQEDWGWFAWCRAGSVRLAVDVFTDDAESGEFRVRLTSRVARWRVLQRVVDAPELEKLRGLVERELTAWSGTPVSAERVSEP